MNLADLTDALCIERDRTVFIVTVPRPQISFALLSALFTACAASNSTPEAPSPEGWEEVSARLVTVVRESRSTVSQWLVEADNCRLSITQIRRRIYAYPNAIVRTTTLIPLGEITSLQIDDVDRLIRIWTTKNAVTITVEDTEKGTDQQFHSLSTITFQYRVRERIPEVWEALLEAAEICGARPAVNS